MRVMRLAILATIVTAVVGCDKAKQLAGGGSAQAAEVPAEDRLDLSRRPDILFQVFGEGEDPRMIPIAAILDGALRPIVLSSNGWRQFDALYLRQGSTYNLFDDGRSIGTVYVRRGMWEDADQPLYTLPNCELLTPLAAVSIDARRKVGYTVEFLASSAQLGRAATAGMSQRDVNAAAATIAREAAEQNGLGAGALQGLEMRAVAIAAGATDRPTIAVAYVDPGAEEKVSSGQTTTHLFAIGDIGADGRYHPTFAHVVSGAASNAEYRRYIDHLDIDRDGTDEILLEGWQYGGDTWLVQLSYAGGIWNERFRSHASWCLDG